MICEDLFLGGGEEEQNGTGWEMGSFSQLSRSRDKVNGKSVDFLKSSSRG